MVRIASQAKLVSMKVFDDFRIITAVPNLPPDPGKFLSNKSWNSYHIAK